MQITELRIAGFKSFVDPQTVPIEPGLTGIVGPNGCGKSNLLEALRWAMGANSAKAMRGGEMDDLIFNGADGRPARETAEVILVLDNSKRTAPPEFNGADQLEIERRLRRGAGSSYRINGRTVRGKDIQLLFADASTGANSPALVRQGQISELIGSKPQNRRRILEEAAGIAGLNSRRHEAELKLDGAEANLQRLAEVSAEVERQLASLKRQAAKARRYRKLTDEIQALDALVAHLRWVEARLAAETARAQLDMLRRQVEDLSREDALRVAVRTLRYQQADLGVGSRDGLLIAPRPGRAGQYALVWQLSFREMEDGSRPVEAQVLARGSQKGTLLRTRSLEHSLTRAPVAIYDASVTAVIPNPIYKGVKVLQNGEPTLIGRVLPLAEARRANTQFEKVLDFFTEEFDRNSFDDQGAEVTASVNVQKYTFLDILGQKQNAAWVAPWKLFIFGAGGEELGNFAGALDVVGHEYTHAVISHSSDLIYEGEPGALNEHLADVFGAMIEQASGVNSNPFLIGDTVLLEPLKKEAEALRDMLHPEKGLSPQPGKISETPPEFAPGCVPSGGNDNCGVHILSGIPNRAFALMTEKLGWETLRGISYRVMTQRLRSTSDFRDYRAQFEDECEKSLTRTMCRSVKRAFDAVEIEI